MPAEHQRGVVEPVLGAALVRTLWRLVEGYFDRFYAIADGIKLLLFSSHSGLAPPATPPRRQFSLLPIDS